MEGLLSTWPTLSIFFTSVFNFLLVGDFFLESLQFNKNFSGTRQFVYEICIESLFGGTLASYDCQYISDKTGDKLYHNTPSRNKRFDAWSIKI